MIDLRTIPAYGGLDLSSKHDLTAFSLVWPYDGKFIAAEWYWLPEDNIVKRVSRDRVEYDLWIADGWIKTTPGDVVDDRQVREDVIALGNIFDIREIAFDPYGARVIAPDLNDAGFVMVEFQQYATWYDLPTRELLNLILQHRMIHERNPVTRFCAQCIAVKRDANDRIKPDKPDRRKSNSRIDGVVARIMALDRALRNQNNSEPSFYGG